MPFLSARRPSPIPLPSTLPPKSLKTYFNTVGTRGRHQQAVYLCHTTLEMSPAREMSPLAAHNGDFPNGWHLKGPLPP